MSKLSELDAIMDGLKSSQLDAMIKIIEKHKAEMNSAISDFEVKTEGIAKGIGFAGAMAKSIQDRPKGRNHYVSVVVDGNIIGWTGANPEKKPESKIEALQRAECYRSMGHTAYAVEVVEIKQEDVQ